jgi:nitrile hydratase subunit beta
MNGIHDLGGMHGLGPVVREESEPVFHEEWERRVFAVLNLTMAAGQYNVDELRHAIERMAPARYLESSYYEHWLHAAEDLLDAKGVVTHGEIARRAAEIAQRSAPEESRRPSDPERRGAASGVGVPDADRRRSE